MAEEPVYKGRWQKLATFAVIFFMLSYVALALGLFGGIYLLVSAEARLWQRIMMCLAAFLRAGVGFVLFQAAAFMISLAVDLDRTVRGALAASGGALQGENAEG